MKIFRHFRTAIDDRLWLETMELRVNLVVLPTEPAAIVLIRWAFLPSRAARNFVFAEPIINAVVKQNAAAVGVDMDATVVRPEFAGAKCFERSHVKNSLFSLRRCALFAFAGPEDHSADHEHHAAAKKKGQPPIESVWNRHEQEDEHAMHHA